jgi:hypothetical protein
VAPSAGKLALLLERGGELVDRARAELDDIFCDALELASPAGEGGFGLVFMAGQQQPIRRKVALKILKPGMDTRQVIARFEAERQARWQAPLPPPILPPAL